MDDYYRILEISPGASIEEIKEAYRTLANVWHPDRFAHDSKLKDKAQEKMCKINEAYQKLRIKNSKENRKNDQDAGNGDKAAATDYESNSQRDSTANQDNTEHNPWEDLDFDRKFRRESRDRNNRRNTSSNQCPNCGFTFGWDGTSCRHCRYDNNAPEQDEEKAFWEDVIRVKKRYLVKGKTSSIYISAHSPEEALAKATSLGIDPVNISQVD